tara:strand:+ start:227 stop:700 length:474 start_codon:yes stop_codon:yes gene_type:complete
VPPTEGSKVVFSIETDEDILRDYSGVLEEHYPELDWTEGKLPCSVDFDKYQLIYKNGNMVFLTARYNEELIGYCSVYADYHLHNKDKVYGIVDFFYLKKDYRKGSVGLRFVKFIETKMKEFNIDVFCIQSRAKRDTGKLLTRLGYTEVETVYGKILE